MKEKQTNTQLARQVIKFTEEMDKLDKEKKAKEKELEQVRKEMQDNYAKKEVVDELHQQISQLKAALQNQQEESAALKKTSKFMEEKLQKVTAEKELYLTEVLKQKEK